MPTRTIACMNCGMEGEIEMQGLNSTVSPAKIFRHLGHNPFSGHMHYQCPACEIVLLVDPMVVLSDDTTPLSSCWMPQKSERRHSADIPCMTSLFQRIFQH